jgi:hypothetical protein
MIRELLPAFWRGERTARGYTHRSRPVAVAITHWNSCGCQIVTRFPDSLDSLFGPDLYFGPDMLLHRFYGRLVSTRRRFTNICIRDFRGQRLQRSNNCRIGKERRVIDRSGAGPWNMDRYFDDWDSEAVLLTAKLKTNNRARRKEQYLRIQACTLAPRAGLEIFLPGTYFFEGIGEPDGDGKAFSVSRHCAAIRVAVSKSTPAAFAFPMA